MPADQNLPFAQPSKADQKSYLVRIEGVNHDQFIFDTNDLSTVRGGSLLLLDAVEGIAQAVGKGCKTISSGASSGLFQLPCASAEEAVTTLRKILREGPGWAHASFVVAAVPESGNFPEDNETLIALNRHEQMTMPSLQVPSPEKPNLGVCAIDRIRPAQETSTRKIKGQANLALSASVHARREYGLNKKQNFYANAVSDPALKARLGKPGLRFADDFSDIADDPTRGILHGKLAVFYADGNGFGKHQRNARKPGDLSEWDGHIRTLRRQMLDQLIAPFLSDVENGDAGKVRFETLLWGGDELLFVAPAWEGINLVNKFLTATSGWKYPPKSGHSLTHAMGLVFCHSNTPISKVRLLAKNLGDHAKADAGRQVNGLHTVVLESFDHVGAFWPDYLARTYARRVTSKDRVILGSQWCACIADWTRLKTGLPKGRLYDYLRVLLGCDPIPDDAVQRLTHDLPADLKALLAEKAHDRPWFFHAAELWDYLPNPAPGSAADTTAPNATSGDRA